MPPLKGLSREGMHAGSTGDCRRNVKAAVFLIIMDDPIVLCSSVSLLQTF